MYVVVNKARGNQAAEHQRIKAEIMQGTGRGGKAIPVYSAYKL